MDMAETGLTEGDLRGAVVRLSDCIQLMQAGLVHANPTPENLDHPVSDVLMYDPLDEWTSVDDRIILAAGLTCGSADFDQLLHRASNSNAAAVIVKAHGAPMHRLHSAAVQHSLAVLVAPEHTDWTRLVALARASVMGAATDSVSGVRLGDLYAFANAAASITNGAASIVDPLGRVLGYSTLPASLSMNCAAPPPSPCRRSSRPPSMPILRSFMHPPAPF